MNKETKLLWIKFAALKNDVHEFNNFLHNKRQDHVLTDGAGFFQKTTGLEGELAKSDFSDIIKKKLKICVFLATEAGILSWYLFYKDSDNLSAVEAFIKKGKMLIKEETRDGFDRMGHIKDYDILLNLKRKNVKEYVQLTVKAMMKEICEAFLSLFQEAEQELKRGGLYHF